MTTPSPGRARRAATAAPRRHSKASRSREFHICNDFQNGAGIARLSRKYSLPRITVEAILRRDFKRGWNFARASFRKLCTGRWD